MSFPPALKSMNTRGFSARVAKPRSAEAPSLAETQASFVAASIVETINAFKGQFHNSALFSNTKSKLLLERWLRFVLRLGGCDVRYQGCGGFSISTVVEDDDSLVRLIKQTSTQKRTFRCSETSAAQSVASGCSEPRSCWLCGSTRGHASASGSASEPSVYTLLARMTIHLCLHVKAGESTSRVRNGGGVSCIKDGETASRITTGETASRGKAGKSTSRIGVCGSTGTSTHSEGSAMLGITLSPTLFGLLSNGSGGSTEDTHKSL